jgi:hypothetical protein
MPSLTPSGSMNFRVGGVRVGNRRVTLRCVPHDRNVETHMKTIEECIKHWRIRRHVWFCAYYQPLTSQENPQAAWAALMEYDNVLNDLEQAGLVPNHWQSSPPRSTTDNGGFAESFLRTYLHEKDWPKNQPQETA